MPNRLAASTSPYLLQHQHNPVSWWEWDPEAFAEARRRDVPVLISIGYAACHWCHVMAHESFEHDGTAALMNEHFVNIKVDREERPDVDAVYMAVTQQLNRGHGGWPMTVFCTPDGKPFYAGTYYPPEPRHGMASFPQVLTALAEAWRERRDDLEEAGRSIVAHVESVSALPPGEGPPTRDELDQAVGVLARDFDGHAGGFGSAPKFPPAMVLEFLTRHVARSGDTETGRRALEMVEHTAQRMARGGMYDQLGGGFARYSVDAEWVVPHFEKMLYDNALLLRFYLHWHRLTGSPLARRIAEETARFVVRDLGTPEGGFASSLDADTEGVEGRYYAWTPQQLREVLGDEAGNRAAGWWEVTDEGTFEHGASVLQLRHDPEDLDAYAEARAKLEAERAQRTPPGRDDKVVAAWNGLAIAALAEAGALLGNEEWASAATAAAELLLRVHVDDEGTRLVRTSRGGQAGRHPGVLEDYADVAEGLLTLYAVTAEQRWIGAAGRLLDAVLTRFRDADGTLHDTAADAEPLITRPRDVTDGATPSGTTAAAGALLTYSAYTGSEPHRSAAEQALRTVGLLAQRAPQAAGWGLAVAEALVDGPREVAVVGQLDDPSTRALWRTALRGTAPGAAVAAGTPKAKLGPVVLLHDRDLVNGQPTCYVCRHFVCDRPVTETAEVAQAVGARE